MAFTISGDDGNLDLTNPAYNPITVTGTIVAGPNSVALTINLAANGVAVPGTLFNEGTIAGGLYGVLLYAGGASSGAYVSNSGTITGSIGLNVFDGTASLVNSGTIIGATGSGVDLEAGGTITNAAGGTIFSQGRGTGIYIGNGVGGVTNSGSIAGYRGIDIPVGQAQITNAGVIIGRQKGAIDLGGGGSVTNAAGGTITTQGTAAAIDIGGGAGSVFNAGAITAADGFGILLTGGGGVTNAATGTITGGPDPAIDADAAASLFNSGRLSASAGAATVVLKQSGYIGNFDSASIIAAASDAIYVTGSAAGIGTVFNTGSVIAAGTFGSAIRMLTAGYVLNGGLLQSLAQGAVDLLAGGRVANNTGGTIDAQGAGAGIYITGSADLTGTVTNTGTLQSASGDGVAQLISGYLLNRGLISGAISGVRENGAAVTVANYGTIAATSTIAGTLSTGIGIDSRASGGQFVSGGTVSALSFVSNADTALISGAYGVISFGAATTVQNAGTLAGGLDGVYLTNGGLIGNATGGTIGASGLVAGNATAVAYGIRLGVAGGSISNAGTISGRNGGIVLEAGGTVKNQIGGTIAVAIPVAPVTYGDIVTSGSLPTTILNAGTIGAVGPIAQHGVLSSYPGADGATGLRNGSDLLLTNLATGLIGGAYGIFSTAGAVSIVNAGTIAANQTLTTGVKLPSAIYVQNNLAGSFYLNNQSTGQLIGPSGIVVVSIPGTIFNAGSISANQTIVQNGAIRLGAGGYVDNEAGGFVGGIYASLGPIDATQSTTILNAGTVQGAFTAFGALSGTVLNMATGLIVSSATSFPNSLAGPSGVYIASGSIINAGTITGGLPALVQHYGTYLYGIYLGGAVPAAKGFAAMAAGSQNYLYNQATGVIGDGIKITADSLVKNAGFISNGVYVLLDNSTIINTGTITPSVYNKPQNGGPGVRASDATVFNSGTIFGAGTHAAVSLSGMDSRLILAPNGVLRNDSGTLLATARTRSGYVATLELAAGVGSLTKLGTAITNFNSLVFDPGAIWFVAGNSTGLSGQISGFAAGDVIDVDGFAAQDSSYLNGVLTLTSAANGMITLDLPGSFDTSSFTIASDLNGGTEVGVACFAAGTRIATQSGEVAVETLAIGDMVLTAAGAARPVRWIGRRSYAARFVAGNRNVLPVVIRAGALADGIPARTLSVSPKHAMHLDGVLVPAELLVNGVSIVQYDQGGDLAYFHVELDSHDILLAEGAPSESFVDCDSRMMFQNAHEFARLHPYGLGESWAFCGERIEDGPQLETIRRRIARRAGLAGYHAEDAAPGTADGRIDVAGDSELSGWAWDPARPHTRLAVELLVDGAVVAIVIANAYRADLAAAGKGRGRCAFSHRFAVPLAGTTNHRLAARVAGAEPFASLDFYLAA